MYALRQPVPYAQTERFHKNSRCYSWLATVCPEAEQWFFVLEGACQHVAALHYL